MKISDSLIHKTIAILGYGNQGRAHALNLRDSGAQVVVGSRPGKSWNRAEEDGFQPRAFRQAVEGADIVMLLFPDEVIPAIHSELGTVFRGKAVGFAHGFAYHFKRIEPAPGVKYFLVAPKGPGALLRSRYVAGDGLPAIYALGAGCTAEEEPMIRAYAEALGSARRGIWKTTFEEETVCDLFGEQAVLCGGIMALLEEGFKTLTEAGYDRKAAFLECCFEAKTILDLWIKHGPGGSAERISPTAFYGGTTRGNRVISESVKKEMRKILTEIQKGQFADEWEAEVRTGSKTLERERSRRHESELQKVFNELTSFISE